MERIAEVVASLFRKAGDQRDGRLDTVAIGARDALYGVRQVQFLIDHVLQSLRTSLDTEKDSNASGARHQLQQVIIDAVSARAATPRELFSAFQYGLAKR